MLSREENRRVRDYLWELLEDFDGNRTRLARFLGVSQPRISQVLRSKGARAGLKLLQSLERTGKSIPEILGRQEPYLQLEAAGLRQENEGLKATLRALVADFEKQEKALAVLSLRHRAVRDRLNEIRRGTDL